MVTVFVLGGRGQGGGDSQAVEPVTHCLRQFAYRCLHIHRRRAGLDQRQVGQCTTTQWQAHFQGKAAAQPGLADHADFAVHHLRQPPANRQAKPGAAFAGGVRCLVEQIEELGLLRLGNANAGIGDLPFQVDIIGVAAHHPGTNHHAPKVGELDGVAHQVIEDLADAHRIAHQAVRQLRVDATVKLQPLAPGEGGVGVQGIFEHVQRAEIHGFYRHLPRLDLRDIQHITDQLEQCGGRTLDGVQVRFLVRVEVGQAEQFEGAEHAIKRRADLMAHGCQEQRLGLAGRIGGMTCLFQGLGVFDVPGDIVECIQAYVLSLIAGRHKADLQVPAFDLQVRLTALGAIVLTGHCLHQA